MEGTGRSLSVAEETGVWETKLQDRIGIGRGDEVGQSEKK